ncbi:transporter substrate-binding domain-containing protein [Pseudomonas sp. 2FE]|uniref:transporter substrate-binding domain-containing protein n=1 Tax=Pseudomonas sp. 2FE TaxID=2502190 RepID=UPI0010F9A02C|nr:transporter substrate-binding domain-containing protein [Pseudomonas sp. 2FE]
MKKIFSAIVASGLLTLAASQASANEKLVFGITLEPYPPFSMKAGNGEWQGFEPELVHALCEQMKAECTLKEISWDGLIPALQANQINAILNSVSITAERLQVIDFSKPYYRTPATWVGDKNLPLKPTPEGLKAKQIGVQSSTTNAAYVKQYYSKDSTLRYYNTQDDMTADLQSGRIDIMLVDALSVEPLLKTAGGEALAEMGNAPNDPLFGDGVGVAIRKGDMALKSKIDQGLDALRDNGTYDKIRSRYFSMDISVH